eukprot:2543827-Pleurochrysis_carterae.AAC.1
MDTPSALSATTTAKRSGFIYCTPLDRACFYHSRLRIARSVTHASATAQRRRAALAVSLAFPRRRLRVF